MNVVDKGPVVLSYVINCFKMILFSPSSSWATYIPFSFLHYKCNVRWNLHFHILNAVYKFSCVGIYKRPDCGSQLKPKLVAVNKLIKTGVQCD